MEHKPIFTTPCYLLASQLPSSFPVMSKNFCRFVEMYCQHLDEQNKRLIRKHGQSNSLQKWQRTAA